MEGRLRVFSDRRAAEQRYFPVFVARPKWAGSIIMKRLWVQDCMQRVGIGGREAEDCVYVALRMQCERDPCILCPAADRASVHEPSYENSVLVATSRAVIVTSTRSRSSAPSTTLCVHAPPPAAATHGFLARNTNGPHLQVLHVWTEIGLGAMRDSLERIAAFLMLPPPAHPQTARVQRAGAHHAPARLLGRARPCWGRAWASSLAQWIGTRLAGRGTGTGVCGGAPSGVRGARGHARGGCGGAERTSEQAQDALERRRRYSGTSSH
ncbi:hypothetical protein GGX14DRAFT_578797 [Mycena pura]|uniref:Uncharacterized protein n=1 Tax=Mycena pura TaxID=153505 RepID=A0AAD6UP84_9AGAR|nr:hypothetical protein GGX14DRAFT_578797 [Mycena pura]